MIVDNSILLDIKSLNHKLHNRTKGKLRLYLGEFTENDFNITVDTIKNLPEEQQNILRNHIKLMVSEF